MPRPALPGAPGQRDHGPVGGEKAGAVVVDRGRGQARHAVRRGLPFPVTTCPWPPGPAAPSRGAADQGPSGTVAVLRHVHDPRPQVRDLFRRQATPGQRAQPVALGEHVRRRGSGRAWPAACSATFRSRNACRFPMPVSSSNKSPGLQVRSADVQDVRSVLGQRLRARRAGQHPGQIDDPHSRGRPVPVGQRLGRCVADLGDGHHRPARQGPALRVLGPLLPGADHAAAHLAADQAPPPARTRPAGPPRRRRPRRVADSVEPEFLQDLRGVVERAVQLDVAAVPRGDDPGDRPTFRRAWGIDPAAVWPARPGGARTGRTPGWPRHGARPRSRAGSGRSAAAIARWRPGR